MGGGVDTGTPNGFLEPVWCVFTGCTAGGPVDAEGIDVSGADAGRAGPAFVTAAFGC